MHHPLNLLIAASAVATSLAFLSPSSSLQETLHSSSEIDLSALQGEDKGAELYSQWCASCHGVNGRDFIQRTWKLALSSGSLKLSGAANERLFRSSMSWELSCVTARNGRRGGGVSGSVLVLPNHLRLPPRCLCVSRTPSCACASRCVCVTRYQPQAG